MMGFGIVEKTPVFEDYVARLFARPAFVKALAADTACAEEFARRAALV
jgi:hypothetical protein